MRFSHYPDGTCPIFNQPEEPTMVELQVKVSQYQTAQALLNEARYQVQMNDSDARLLDGAREVAHLTEHLKIKGIKIIYKLTNSTLKEAKDLWEYANWLNQQDADQ